MWIVVDPTPQLAVLVKVASSVVTVNRSIATQTVYVCRRLAVIQSKIPMNPVWIVAGPDVRVVWMAIHAPLMVTVLICSVDTTSRQRVNQQIVVMVFLMVMKRVLKAVRHVWDKKDMVPKWGEQLQADVDSLCFGERSHLDRQKSDLHESDALYGAKIIRGVWLD